MAKKLLIGISIFLGVVVLAVAGLVGWLTVTEYRPAGVEDIADAQDSGAARSLSAGDSLTILSQNTGKPLDEIIRATERDNFLTAEEAKEYGLIDMVYEKRQ